MFVQVYANPNICKGIMNILKWKVRRDVHTCTSKLQLPYFIDRFVVNHYHL